MCVLFQFRAIGCRCDARSFRELSVEVGFRAISGVQHDLQKWLLRRWYENAGDDGDGMDCLDADDDIAIVIIDGKVIARGDLSAR